MAAPKSGERNLKIRVRTAKKRTVASTRWLERQLNDPYVLRAKKQGYRSRAAFKLIELDDRFKFLAPGRVVVDLGAAPGGWSQVAAERVKSADGRGRVLAIDIQEITPIPGVDILQADFLAPDAPERLLALLNGAKADVLLSDMAASSTGHRQTDHWKIIALAETAGEFARDVLAPGGSFVAKVLQGGSETDLLNTLKRDFASVRHVKPPASRADSAELYVVALGFRGGGATPE